MLFRFLAMPHFSFLWGLTLSCLPIDHAAAAAAKSLQSCPTLCATPWTAAYQASPSMGFSRQEHWSGLPFPSPAHWPYLPPKI